MIARILTYGLVLCTFCLILLGGLVHTTGASLACPDWPLCFGQVFPVMQGGVLYEHSHRLLASAVGLLVLVLNGVLWPRKDTWLRLLAFVGVALVSIQGLLGGLTVLWRLPPWVSVTHWSTSLLFFAWTWVMWLTVRVTQAKGPGLAPRSLRTLWLTAPMDDFGIRQPKILQRRVLWALGLLFVQMVLGAWVRHRGASLACGLEVFRCAQQSFPVTGLQWLQTSHRLLAVLVTGVLIATSIGPMKLARKAKRQDIRLLGASLHIVVLLQVLLGALTIKTAVHLHVVMTHVALGAILWALMVVFYLRLCPLGTGKGVYLQPGLSVQPRLSMDAS